VVEQDLKMRASIPAALLGVTALLAQPCYATHWQVIGRPNNDTLGLAYVDMDSIHADSQYRVATFLTVYSNATSNEHGIKLDRIAQETAFDCEKHTFSLVSTVSYYEGKKTGSSSGDGDWKARFKGLYEDGFSQRAFDVTCNAPLVTKPPPATAADSPANVMLPTAGAPQ
jgi:hypothetical protein